MTPKQTTSNRQLAEQKPQAPQPCPPSWLLIDRPRRTVCVSGRRVELRRKEYELLLCLVDHANDFVPRRQIMDEVWSDDQGISSNSLHVHLSRLRSKLGEGHDRPVFIQTSRGDGVLFGGHRGHTFEPYTELYVPRSAVPQVRSAA